MTWGALSVRPEAWEAFPGEGTNNSPAYHLQESGGRQHRRVAEMPEWKWTGELRPAVVSPKRRVPALGWLMPLPDYARTGWPDAEFGSPLQQRLEARPPNRSLFSLN